MTNAYKINVSARKYDMHNVTPRICWRTNSKNRDSRQLNSARGQETGTVKNSVLPRWRSAAITCLFAMDLALRNGEY